MLLSFVRAVSEWYGHPHSQNPSDMGISVTLTQIAKVIWEGDAHITRVLGMGMPKTRGCPYHCKSRQLEPSNYRIGIGLPWKSRTSLEEKNAPDCPDLSPSIPDKDPALTNAFSLLSKIDSRPRYSFDAFTTVHTLGRKQNPMNMVKTYGPAILRFWCVFDLSH